MTFEGLVRGDLDVFINDAEFAIQALIRGDFVAGVFDPGMEGDREPRSPHFLCKDSDLKDIQHGEEVLIDWTEYDVTQTGVITYWVEGYQPDGTGLATLVLKERSDVIPMFILGIQALIHAHPVDVVAVFLSQFPLVVDATRHGHTLDEPELLDIRVKIDATRDQVNKTGLQVSSIVATDGRTYTVQGGTGVDHDFNQSPGGEPVYTFDGTPGSFLSGAVPEQIDQAFTVFAVARVIGSGIQAIFDNQS